MKEGVHTQKQLDQLKDELNIKEVETETYELGGKEVLVRYIDNEAFVSWNGLDLRFSLDEMTKVHLPPLARFYGLDITELGTVYWNIKKRLSS